MGTIINNYYNYKRIKNKIIDNNIINGRYKYNNNMIYSNYIFRVM